MAEIAAAAGVSRQAVYLHFASRGGLLMALVKRADERFHIREDLEKALEVKDPAARLETWLRAWFVFAGKIHPVARDLVRLRASDADAAAAWEDRMGELQHWLRQLVASLKAEGALAPGWNVKDAADYLWTASSVPVWDLLVADCGWAKAKTAKRLTATISATLLAPPALARPPASAG